MTKREADYPDISEEGIGAPEDFGCCQGPMAWRCARSRNKAEPKKTPTKKT